MSKKKSVGKKLLFMGKQAQTLELITNLKLCTIPRVMYCGAIARVIGLRVCAIVHNNLIYTPFKKYTNLNTNTNGKLH